MVRSLVLPRSIAYFALIGFLTFSPAASHAQDEKTQVVQPALDLFGEEIYSDLAEDHQYQAHDDEEGDLHAHVYEKCTQQLAKQDTGSSLNVWSVSWTP